MQVYVDSVILIYFLEHVGPLHTRAATRMAALRLAGDSVAVSDLVRMGCRVVPLRLADHGRLALFDNFFVLRDVRVLPMTTSVFDRATEIRAQFGLKTVDSSQPPSNTAAAIS